MKAIRLGIVEDNHALRKRMIEHLSFEEEISLVKAVDNGEDMVRFAKENPPLNVVLMDIELPGISGIETTDRIKSLWPKVDIIMFTVYEDDERVFDSIVSGASGYLLKDTDFDRIVEAIYEIHQGGSPISPSIARKLLKLVKPGVVLEKEPEQQFDLTEREVEILRLVTDGKSNKEIAEHLFVSPLTIKTHVKNIYEKLHVHSRAAAAKLALKHKLI
ncbi:response regulator transcription factor [bacterium]|nr:MAG: response regulator transcription factor [bacterium]